MTKMHRYAAIAALAIFLSGCMAQRQLRQLKEEGKTSARTGGPPQPPVVPSVPTIPTATGADRTRRSNGPASA